MTVSKPEMIDEPRRRLLGAAGVTLAAAALGLARPAIAATSAAPAFGTVKQVKAGVLDIGTVDEGPADGPAVLLLHGWPYDIHSYIDVVPRLASAGFRVVVPYLRGYGTTRFLDPAAARTAQPTAMAADAIALMDALGIRTAIVAGFDWGARTANIMATLWPERCRAMVSVSGYLIGNPADAASPLPPEAEHEWWYQYYFATQRGRDGYAKYTDDFARLIWRLASPQWQFGEATFARTAAAFANPDHVDIVVQNYRWRLGLTGGDPRYDALEKRLVATPTIAIPTVTLEGDANGAPHPQPADYAWRFTGKYMHRLITGGIGHDLPQEAPLPFVAAIHEAAGLAA